MALRRILTGWLPLSACLLVPGYIAAQPPQFTIQDVGTLPNLPSCNGTSLSQSGNVVGYCTSQLGQNLLLSTQTPHVFLYSNGAMTDLNATSPPMAFPTGVNDSGVVVGGALLIDLQGETATASPFIYENGAVQPISGATETLLPLGLNNAGQVVGTSIEVMGNSLNLFINSKAYLDPLSGGTLTQLVAPGSGGSVAAFGINANGVVAGATLGQNATDVTPLLWQSLTPQALPLLAGYPQEVATSVNDSGVAVGTAFNVNFSVFSDPTATAHAVLFNNGAVTDLGVLTHDVSSQAMSINNSGSVVGFSSSKPPDFTLHLAAYVDAPENYYHAFIYSGGKMYDLTQQTVNGAGWQLSFATQINNAGQIVGTGLYEGPDGVTVQRAFLLTPLAGPAIGNIVGAGFSTPAVTGISPNGVFTIFGSDLANTTQGVGEIVANQLPTNLAGSCVQSGTTKWSLYYASPGQINALAGPLPASGTVPVTVVLNCGTDNEVTSTAMNVPVAAVTPEFLYFLENANGDNPVAAVDDTTNVYAGPPGLTSGATFAPVHAADLVTAYGVGWGATTSSDPIGTLASAAATITSSYSLTLGGMPAKVSYIGLSGDAAGLYQVNFTVPTGLAAGNQALVLTVDGVSTTSNAFITVAN
jgi:uncharacterized protein (TIGR03437 family)